VPSKRLDQPDPRSEWCIYLGLEANSPGHHQQQHCITHSRRKFDPRSDYSGQWSCPPRVTTRGPSFLRLSDQEIEPASAFGVDRHQHQQRINLVIHAPVEPPVSLRNTGQPQSSLRRWVPQWEHQMRQFTPTAAAYLASAVEAATMHEGPPVAAQGAPLCDWLKGRHYRGGVPAVAQGASSPRRSASRGPKGAIAVDEWQSQRRWPP
jgi:hypothetical protein